MPLLAPDTTAILISVDKADILMHRESNEQRTSEHEPLILSVLHASMHSDIADVLDCFFLDLGFLFSMVSCRFNFHLPVFIGPHIMYKLLGAHNKNARRVSQLMNLSAHQPEKLGRLPPCIRNEWRRATTY